MFLVTTGFLTNRLEYQPSNKINPTGSISSWQNTFFPENFTFIFVSLRLDTEQYAVSASQVGHTINHVFFQYIALYLLLIIVTREALYEEELYEKNEWNPFTFWICMCAKFAQVKHWSNKGCQDMWFD